MVKHQLIKRFQKMKLLTRKSQELTFSQLHNFSSKKLFQQHRESICLWGWKKTIEEFLWLDTSIKLVSFCISRHFTMCFGLEGVFVTPTQIRE